MIPGHLMSKGFLSRQAGSFSGVPQRTVQGWTERGLITPDIAGTTGTGSRRLYSVENCIQIGIIKALTTQGLPIRQISFIMSQMLTKTKLWELLEEPVAFLTVHLPPFDYTIVSPQLSITTFERAPSSDRKGSGWWKTTAPIDCDAVLILNLTRIAKRVVEKIEVA